MSELTVAVRVVADVVSGEARDKFVKVFDKLLSIVQLFSAVCY